LATGELQCQFQNQLSYFQRRYENLYGFPWCSHATQSQMLKKQFGGENVFQGRIIEVHLGTYCWSTLLLQIGREMKAKLLFVFLKMKLWSNLWDC
jgi:aconitase B